MPRESNVARKKKRKSTQNSNEQGTPVFALRAEALKKVSKEVGGQKGRIPNPKVSDNVRPLRPRSKRAA